MAVFPTIPHRLDLMGAGTAPFPLLQCCSHASPRMIESIISHLVNIVNGGMGAASIWRSTRVQHDSVCKTISKAVDRAQTRRMVHV